MKRFPRPAVHDGTRREPHCPPRTDGDTRCDPQTLDALQRQLFRAPETAAACPAQTRRASSCWAGPCVSLALHGLLLTGLILGGAFSFSVAQQPAQAIVELDLGMLAGPGGPGGDGQPPGGGDGGAAPGTPVPEPPAQATPPAAATAPETPPVAAQTPPEPPAEPEPTRLPPKEVAPQPTPPRPKPRKQPTVRRQAAKQPVPAKVAVHPVRAAVPAAATGGTASEMAGHVPGPVGPGHGTGPGKGPGPGGSGGAGPGGGGGGEYVGHFGQGDGPRFRHRTLPQYPSEAKRENREGKVVLCLTIDADGELRDAKVLSHTGLEFVEAALRAIRKSSFFPAKQNGRPIPSRARLAIRFTLH